MFPSNTSRIGLRKYTTITNRNSRFNIIKLEADIQFCCKIAPVFSSGVRGFKTIRFLSSKQSSSSQSGTGKSSNNSSGTIIEKVSNFLVAVVHKCCLLLSLDVTKLSPKTYGLVTMKPSVATSTYNFF